MERAAKKTIMLVPVVVDAAAKEWSGEITLRIGNHVLAGKVAKLPKPFAILQKDGGSDGDVVMLEDGNDAAGQTKYEVVGIARTRVVFASRPKPVLD
ncbi:Chromosome transmission fidelity protein 8 [Phytophthora cactorum]|nr:Chromosome transmission fidelity protein 8 [Phytophthora cactorum]